MNATQALRLLAVLAVVVPALIFTVATWLSYEEHLDDARARLARTSQIVREHATKVFETNELVVEQIEQILYGLADEQVTAQEANLHPRLKRLADDLDQIEDIWVLDAAGRPLLTAYLPSAPRDLDLSDRAYYRVFSDRSQAPNQTYVSGILQGRARPGTYFQMSVARMARDGSFAGVTSISVEPRYFLDFYSTVASSYVSNVALIREDGAILSRFPGRVEDLPNLPLAVNFVRETEKQPASGGYEGKSSIDGVTRLVAYEKLPAFPVYVAVSHDKSAVLAAWRSDMARHLYFGIPATLALLGLCLAALRLTQKETAALANLRDEVRRREQSDDQVRQMQKMEAVGRLSGGIAHDFNNLMTIVLGSLDLARRRLARGERDIGRYLDNATEGAQRAVALTQRLLAFSRKQPLEPKPIDCNRLVAGMSDLLTHTLGEQIRIETVLAAGLWQTNIDANQLENAIINLAVNARDAMPDGGRLTIETSCAHLDDGYVSGQPDLPPGQYVLVSVTDTGVGMTPQVVAEAFDPFFTTKPQGQGTGLGLSQVYGFVKQSGGHVKIYSEVEQGTSVKIYLPRYFGAARPATAVSAPASVLRSGSEAILVVEDEEAVRRFSTEALRELGYRVFEANGAETALAMLDANPDIALLFTDIVMPGPDGKKLAQEAQLRHPRLKVLFTTGYSRNAIIHNGVLDHGVSLIIKPFTLEELATKVGQVLDA